MSTDGKKVTKDKLHLSKKEAAELMKQNQQQVSNMLKELIQTQREKLFPNEFQNIHGDKTNNKFENLGETF